MGEKLLVALTMKGKFGDSGPPSVLVNDRPNNFADGIVERNSNPSNSAHQSLGSGLSIAEKQQHEKHSDERNQARDNDDRIEGMSSSGSPRVGQIAYQLESYDGSDSGAGAAQAAHRRHRF